MIKIEGEQGEQYKQIIKMLQADLKLDTVKEAQKWLFEALGALLKYDDIRTYALKRLTCDDAVLAKSANE